MLPAGSLRIKLHLIALPGGLKPAHVNCMLGRGTDGSHEDPPCDNLRMTDKPRWWLIGVAALMAAIFLYQSIGPVGVIVLAAGSLAGCAVYRFYRARNPAKAPAVRCLTCGETLSSTARACKYCGSARWTIN